MSRRPPPPLTEFRIGWICALQVEVDAARLALDEEYDDVDEVANYVLGRIGRHNVVISCPPAGQIGIAVSAVIATRTWSAFPTIQYWLLVGIGGGVPGPDNDIRLGDIVISQPRGTLGGVVQYDMGKLVPGGERLRTGYLNAPPQDLLTALTKSQSNYVIGRSNFVDRLARIMRPNKFRRPLPESDILFESAYSHVEGTRCDKCDMTRAVTRDQRPSHDVVTHCGLIASGNQVIKDGIERDSLSRDLGGVLCFEMEAAGIMNTFPCLVVRGICDYADSHKRKEWQPFAAAVAASFAGEILSCIASANRPDTVQVRATEKLSTLALSGHALSHESMQAVRAASTTVVSCRPNAEPTSYLTLARHTLSAEQQQHYFESLKFVQLESRHASIRAAHPTTCRWIFTKPEYEDWLYDDRLKFHHGFLWIKGKAGTGKSTLMKLLFSHVKRHQIADVAVAFFFNARGEVVEASTVGMYRSLLYQILDQCPDLIPLLGSCPIKVDASGTIVWTTDVLRILFQVVVAHLKDRSLICVVDALDECDTQEALQMVRFFGDLGIIAVDSNIVMRIAFSSRHYPNIPIKQGISLVIEDQEEHRRDISTYVNSQLATGDSDIVHDISTEVLERSSGIFLWVVLVVDLLNVEYGRGRIHAMQEKLKELPDDVEQLFDDILNRHGRYSEETLLCIQWVLFAEHTLTLEELYYGIRFGAMKSPKSIQNKSGPTEGDMARFVVDVSKGFVEVFSERVRVLRSVFGFKYITQEQQSVQFIHESVRQYFLTQAGSRKFSFRSLDTFICQSHDVLKQCCYEYCRLVSAAVVSSGERTYKCIQSLNLRDFPLLKLAYTTMLYHCDAAEANGHTQDEFLANFDSTMWFNLGVALRNQKIIFLREYGRSILYDAVEKRYFALFKKEVGRVGALEALKLSHRFCVLCGLATANEANRASISLWLRQHELIPPSSIPTGLDLSREAIECIWVLLSTAMCINTHHQGPTMLLNLVTQCGDVESLWVILNCEQIYPTMYKDGILSEARLQSFILKEDWMALIGPEVVHTLKKISNVRAKEWFIKNAARLGRRDVLHILLDATQLAEKHNHHLASIALVHTIIVNDTETAQWLMDTYRLDFASRDSGLRMDALGEVAESYTWSLAQTYTRSMYTSHYDLMKDLMIRTFSRDENLSPSCSGAEAALLRRDAGFGSPLMIAASKGYFIRIVITLCPGLNIDALGSDPRTGSSHTAVRGLTDTVAMLSLRGFPGVLNITTNDGTSRTPLHLAASDDHGRVVQLLLNDSFFNVNSEDVTGLTPLHCAFEQGGIEILKRLLKHTNIDVGVTGSANITRLAKAQYLIHSSILEVLSTYSASKSGDTQSLID